MLIGVNVKVQLCGSHTLHSPLRSSVILGSLIELVQNEIATMRSLSQHYESGVKESHIMDQDFDDLFVFGLCLSERLASANQQDMDLNEFILYFDFDLFKKLKFWIPLKIHNDSIESISVSSATSGLRLPVYERYFLNMERGRILEFNISFDYASRHTTDTHLLYIPHSQSLLSSVTVREKTYLDFHRALCASYEKEIATKRKVEGTGTSVFSRLVQVGVFLFPFSLLVGCTDYCDACTNLNSALV